MACMFLFFCFLLSTAAWIQKAEGGLISQSSITKCEWGNSQEPTTGEGGSTCKKKFLVSMTLKSGQGEVEALYANVRQAYQEGKSEMSTLKKPFRIEISKTQTIASYRAYYRGSANAQPEEHVVYYDHPTKCSDKWRDKHINKGGRLACGKQKAVGTEEYAWDSQGFCCRCNFETRGLRRANATCERRIFNGKYHGYYNDSNDDQRNYGSSAHCMRLHGMWYDLFELDQPMMQYNITIKLLQFNGFKTDPETAAEVANWTTLSTFYLNPSRTTGRSKNGRVVAELQGDLVGTRGPMDLTTKMLLIPSKNLFENDTMRARLAKMNRDPDYWMLVDESMVDLSGLQCNKVGISYSGFRRQPGKCHQEYASCFTNQPLQLWEHDKRLKKRKKKGSYMVYNYGRIHHSTRNKDNSFILRFIHEDLHNSFVTFRIDASDILFVFNVGKGRIVDAQASNFKSLTEVGEMNVQVENTGEITAEFTVVLAECFGRRNLPGKAVMIEPGRIQNVTFYLQSYKMFGEESLCEVQLFDSSFNLLGTAKVNVKVESNCFCYGACGCSCLADGTASVMECPTPPPIVIEEKGIFLRVFLLFLEIIGPQGIIGVIAILLLVFGCLKLCCGGIVSCKKSKAQEQFEEMKEKGLLKKKGMGPELVKCAYECRGAKAAQARYKRKVERIKRMGKTVRHLDDWKNTSYICTCNEELADIRFLNTIKAIFFFYYVCFLPFIWLGKKLWWSIFKDTAANKAAAKKAALREAKKKGKLEKVGVIDLQAELQKIQKKSNLKSELEDETGGDKPPEYGSGGSANTKGKKKENKKDKNASKKAAAAATSSKATPKGVPVVGVGGGKALANLQLTANLVPVFGEDVQTEKAQLSGERKTAEMTKDSPNRPPLKPGKQVPNKATKEQKVKTSNASHQYESRPVRSNNKGGSHSDSGVVDKPVDLSPDKHSPTSLSLTKSKEHLKGETASKHSIASRPSLDSVVSKAESLLESAKEGAAVLQHVSSIKLLHSQSSSSLESVKKTSSHHSNAASSKARSHASKSSSHSAHIKGDSSHSLHSSSSSGKSSHHLTSGSSSSEHSHLKRLLDSKSSSSQSSSSNTSDSKHTSLSSIIPISSEHSGTSMTTTSVSSSASSISLIPGIISSSSSSPFSSILQKSSDNSGTSSSMTTTSISSRSSLTGRSTSSDSHTTVSHSSQSSSGSHTTTTTSNTSHSEDSSNLRSEISAIMSGIFTSQSEHTQSEHSDHSDEDHSESDHTGTDNTEHTTSEYESAHEEESDSEHEESEEESETEHSEDNESTTEGVDTSSEEEHSSEASSHMTSDEHSSGPDVTSEHSEEEHSSEPIASGGHVTSESDHNAHSSDHDEFGSNVPESQSDNVMYSDPHTEPEYYSD